jgi:hypothetical protein
MLPARLSIVSDTHAACPLHLGPRKPPLVAAAVVRSNFDEGQLLLLLKDCNGLGLSDTCPCTTTAPSSPTA